MALCNMYVGQDGGWVACHHSYHTEPHLYVHHRHIVSQAIYLCTVSRININRLLNIISKSITMGGLAVLPIGKVHGGCVN